MTHSLRERNKTEDPDLLLYQLPQDEQTFLLALMDGESQCEAYLLSHPDCSRDAAMVGGSRWIRRDRIEAAREELLEANAREALKILRAAVPQAANTVALAAAGKLEVDPMRLKAATEVLDRTGAIARHGLDLTQGRQQDLRGFIDTDDTPEAP